MCLPDVLKVLPYLVILTLAGSGSVFAEQITDPVKPVSTDTEEPVNSGAQEGSLQVSKTPPQKKPKDPNRGRFLPIPIFITEPAIGDGLGLALAYFHRKKNTPSKPTLASPNSISEASREQTPPPTMTAAFGAYTSNETVAAGAAHINSFKDDHIRFTGVVALADVNSTFYLLDRPLRFNLNGALIYQETRFRLRDSKWFWGIGFSYLDASTQFKNNLTEEPPIEPYSDLFQNDLRNIGLSAKLAWDTRDNTSMPQRGQLFDLAVWRYDEAIGGDFDYWDTRLKMHSFHRLHEKFVLGLRFEYSTISGRAPFFAAPYVKLRGIPALRYQGDRVAVAEIEGRYNFTDRWAMVGFIGAGNVDSDIPIFDTEQDIYAYGLGGRYKIFDVQNIWVGMDIAKGPEEFNWYIQVGHAW